MSSETNGISYVGATVVAVRVLERSKAGKTESESFGSKVARGNFYFRVRAVQYALNSRGGPTLEAAKSLKEDYSFFSDVDDSDLQEFLAEAVAEVKGAKQVRMPEGFEGNLQFAPYDPSTEPEDNEEDEEDFCEDDDDEDEDEDKGEGEAEGVD